MSVSEAIVMLVIIIYVPITFDGRNGLKRYTESSWPDIDID